jgi:tetratricopeptide (TPR) repeat protein
VHGVLEISLHFELGNIDRADREIEAFARSAKYRRDPQAMWYADLFACVRATMDGRWREASEHAQSFLELGHRVGDINAIHSYGAQRVARCWDEGRPEDVIESLEEFARSYPSMFAWNGALGISYLEAGRVNDARRVFEQLKAHDLRNIPWNETGAINYAFLAELAFEFHDKRCADLLYDILLPAESHFVIVGFGSAFWGSFARPLGLLAATRGCLDSAVRHFEYGLLQNTLVRAAPLVARTQYDFARLLLRRGAPGDPERAMDLITEALDTAVRLGLRALYNKLLLLKTDLSLKTPSGF